MRTVSYRSLLEAAALLGGIQPAQLQSEDAAVLNLGLNRALRHAWEFAFWPECTVVAEYRYRPDYDAATLYPTGAEVYSPAAGAYYRAVQPGTGQALADAAYWLPLSGLNWAIYVPWGAGGVPEGATVRRCCQRNPRAASAALEVAFALLREGIAPISDVPASLWIEYRLPCPELTGADYSALAVYAAGAAVLYSGDYYLATTATTAGQSPDTTPTSWSKIELPWRLRDYLVHAAGADMLRAQGQLEKAVAEQSMADDRLYDQLLIHETQSRQARRFRS